MRGWNGMNCKRLKEGREEKWHEFTKKAKFWLFFRWSFGTLMQWVHHYQHSEIFNHVVLIKSALWNIVRQETRFWCVQVMQRYVVLCHWVEPDSFQSAIFSLVSWALRLLSCNILHDRAKVTQTRVCTTCKIVMTSEML